MNWPAYIGLAVVGALVAWALIASVQSTDKRSRESIRRYIFQYERKNKGHDPYE